jgi:hypothetical protein
LCGLNGLDPLFDFLDLVEVFNNGIIGSFNWFWNAVFPSLLINKFLLHGSVALARDERFHRKIQIHSRTWLWLQPWKRKLRLCMESGLWRPTLQHRCWYFPLYLIYILLAPLCLAYFLIGKALMKLRLNIYFQLI